jgi:hypothetical protein
MIDVLGPDPNLSIRSREVRGSASNQLRVSSVFSV